METITTAIIGGGASGLILATRLQNNGKIVLFERGERVGRKLSATGNGQGNITNLGVVCQGGYFSYDAAALTKARRMIDAYNYATLKTYFMRLGVLLVADNRDRVYPASKQASALTDALRFAVEKTTEVRLCSQITRLQKTPDGFLLQVKTAEREYQCLAQNVVLSAGGKAAKNFGTDGSAYALVTAMGHTCTPLYPSLVQLKTDIKHIKTLKGIRVNDAKLTAFEGEKEVVTLRGDIIFTDYGVSGDGVFRISAYVADKLASGNVRLSVDFLPDISLEAIAAAVEQKRSAFPQLPQTEYLFGIVNNQLGRAIVRRADGDTQTAIALVKDFTLPITGSLSFDYAQVTKGGIPLSETDEDLQSRFAEGLYFTGEILDIDGACGGYNLHWAYASARVVADAINAKGRGQVCV